MTYRDVLRTTVAFLVASGVAGACKDKKPKAHTESQGATKTSEATEERAPVATAPVDETANEGNSDAHANETTTDARKETTSDVDEFVKLLSSADAMKATVFEGKLGYGKHLMLADWGLEQDYRLLCGAELDAQLAKTVAWAAPHVAWAREHQALSCLPASDTLPTRCVLGSDAEGGLYVLRSAEGTIEGLIEMGDVGNFENTTAFLEKELSEVGSEVLAKLEALRAKDVCSPAPKKK